MVYTFNLHEEVVAFQENNQVVDNEVLVPDLTQDEIESYLDDFIDQLQEDSTYIMNQNVLDVCRSFIKHFDSLQLRTAEKFIDIILSAFRDVTEIFKQDLDGNAQNSFETNRVLAEMYALFSTCIIERAETRWRNASVPDLATGKKSKSVKNAIAACEGWNWIVQRDAIVDQLDKLLLLNLGRFILVASERDVLMSTICKAVSFILEDADAVKREESRSPLVDVLCVIGSKYDSDSKKGGVRSRIEDYLQEDHLADFVAEVMDAMIANYENKPFFEGILTDISDQHYSDKDLKTTKVISKLLIRLSIIRPKELIKCMASLQSQIDSDSYTIRCAVVEVIGNLIHNHLVNDTSESAARSLHSYYDILIQRLLDINQYVRNKVIQVMFKLSERRPDAPSVTDIPLDIRLQLVGLNIQRLRDKSSIVRKNAIKLLARFIETSPFIAIEDDQGRLSLKYFESRQQNLLEVLQKTYPNEVLGLILPENPTEEVSPEAEKETTDAKMDVEASKDVPNAPEISNVELQRMRGLIKYYEDGIYFIKQIVSAVPCLCELLASSIKSEVVEAMRFFVVAFRYEIEAAWDGVRKMVHKIWDKDTGDNESGSVREHSMKSYESLFMDPPEGTRPVEVVIAENLVTLTQRMNLAELTSLEEMISQMAQAERLHPKAADVLWSIFCSKRSEVTPEKRQGAVMVLGMIGKSKKNILLDNIDMLFKYGLNTASTASEQENLQLARHTCVAMQQAAASKREKGTLAKSFKRLPQDHVIFKRLAYIICQPNASSDWFGFTEQALNAIYALAEHPDVVAGAIVKQVSKTIFYLSQSDIDGVEDLTKSLSETLALNGNGAPIESSDNMQTEQASLAYPNSDKASDLSKLFFLVGHVAVKQIVHLEAIEAEWKRRRHAKQTETREKKPASDLEQVAGTVEDEFVERIMEVRERELLFGEKSLLALFGPMIKQVCIQQELFKDDVLQIMATLALCKFMCVSSQFCEANLPMLFAILEHTKNPIIRSNAIIGLGDMTISFNALIDEHISSLYNCLNDSDSNVKKNTLMVLTFLILNGMVKVKGQISEMAKCIENPDKRISDLAKLFFSELSTKDNAIYNNLPDLISNLSTVDEDTYRNITKFLFEFIKKEKQSESLIEKLCARFKNSFNERQWQDISYCLSLLSFGTEKGFKKLVDYLPFYQDKLHPDKVYKNFADIIKKVKKAPGKPELKRMAEEFETTLDEFRKKCLENHNAAVTAVADTSGVNRIAAHPKKASHRRRDYNEDEEDDEDEPMEEDDMCAEIQDENADELVTPTKPPKKHKTTKSVKLEKVVEAEEPSSDQENDVCFIGNIETTTPSSAGRKKKSQGLKSVPKRPVRSTRQTRRNKVVDESDDE